MPAAHALSAKEIYDLVASALRECGYERSRAGPQTLRNAFLARQIRAGVELERIRDWAGLQTVEQLRALARQVPTAVVEPDPIFVRDGALWTSAGVTAGMDLALAMLEEDHGRDVARAVARELVMFLQRPGGQSQFSTQLAVQAADREPLRELQAWIADHP